MTRTEILIRINVSGKDVLTVYLKFISVAEFYVNKTITLIRLQENNNETFRRDQR